VTGNDIVDMKTAAVESNWKRAGFLEKIFTQKEQQYIRAAVSADQMLWKLWSMKESAYKIYTRQYGGHFFAPQKLSCILLSETAGQVTVNNIIYQTITSTAKDYIYSIARPEGYKQVDFYNACFAMPKQHDAGQQKFIYEKMIAEHARMQCEDKNNFTVLKENGNIPFLYCKKEKLKIPVSITHHGNYAAFTIN